MDESHEKIEALLQSLLVGANIKSFEWSSYYTITFLLRRGGGLPPELNLTICSRWIFKGDHLKDVLIPRALSPLDEMDCLRGFILPGLTTKSVESVSLNGGNVEVFFEGGVSMEIPLENTGDPNEDSLLVKTPEWVKGSCKQDIQIDGSGLLKMNPLATPGTNPRANQ